MVVAAIAHDYPLADRMVLFSLPFVCLALAATVLVSRHAGVQLLFVGLVLVVSVPEIGSAASATVHPYTKTEAREAYVYVQQHERPGDAVLIEWEGVTIFDYYNRTLGVNANGYFRLTGSSTPCENGRQLAQLEQWKRVWLVFAIAPGSESGHPINTYVNAFRSIGRPTSTFLSPGPSGAVLLTLSSSVPTPARSQITGPKLAAGPRRLSLRHCHPDGPVGVDGGGSPIGFGNGITPEARSTSAAEPSRSLSSLTSSGSRTW